MQRPAQPTRRGSRPRFLWMIFVQAKDLNMAKKGETLRCEMHHLPLSDVHEVVGLDEIVNASWET